MPLLSRLEQLLFCSSLLSMYASGVMPNERCPCARDVFTVSACGVRLLEACHVCWPATAVTDLLLLEMVCQTLLLLLWLLMMQPFCVLYVSNHSNSCLKRPVACQLQYTGDQIRPGRMRPQQASESQNSKRLTVIHYSGDVCACHSPYKGVPAVPLWGSGLKVPGPSTIYNIAETKLHSYS